MLYRKFIDNFKRRLDVYDISEISEDSMRYDFFSAFLLSGVSTEQIQLEYLHDNQYLVKKEIDLIVHLANSKIAFELKYFRTIPSDKNDTTNQMGKFIVDILKLKHLSNSIDARYFLFLTDQKMHKYLQKESNGFSKLVTSHGGEKFSISAGDKTGKHYEKAISDKIPNALNPFKSSIKLKKITYHEIGHEHHIACFKVIV